MTDIIPEAAAYPNVQLCIDGKWVDAVDGRTSPVFNPANNEIAGYFSYAGKPDLDAALNAAQRAFKTWRNVSAFDRCKLMRRAAELLRDRHGAIARWMTIEQGKPLAEAKAETLAAADLIDWFAEEARRAYGRVIPARSASVRQLTIKEPVGPTAAFTPWNFPINQAVRKISAALATGCSMIVKGPEETPASPAQLVQVFIDAGLPDGVLQLVFGDPAEISSYLIEHPVIKKISFTGSTTVGKQLASLAGRHMKRVTMELGGHAPVIVLRDADLARAASVSAAGKFRNAGQVCVAPTRFLIEEPVYDEFCSRFTEISRSIEVGDGLEPGVSMGPLANERRVVAMESLIQDALENGADILTGGKRIGNKGNFFGPTVLALTNPHVRAMNEEPFGPLALLVPMAGLDEIMAEANRLDFGLAAYGFTRSSASAERLAQVNAGMMSINHAGLALPELPFGGINESGYGTEGGADALEPYLNTKFITHNQVE